MWSEERNGKYRYFERYTDPMTGKVHRISITLERKSDKKALQMLADKIAGRRHDKCSCSLAEAVEMYLAESSFSVSAATLQRNKNSLQAVMDLLGRDNRLNRLTAGFIREQFIRSGKQARTLNGYITRFSAFIRWAYRHDLIESTSCIDKLEAFKDSPIRARIQDKFLSTEELRVLLEGMTSQGDRLITEFLALSGLRIGELAGLDDVDIDGDVIHVKKSYNPITGEITPGKTLAAVRDVHIQPELDDCIRRLNQFMRLRKIAAGVPRSPFFIISQSGSRLNYYSFNKAFKAATKKILNRQLTPHALRHTHASLLAENGYPLEAISRRLGHDDSRVTKDIYLHVTEEVKKREAEMLDKIALLPPICPRENQKKPGASIL